MPPVGVASRRSPTASVALLSQGDAKRRGSGSARRAALARQRCRAGMQHARTNTHTHTHTFTRKHAHANTHGVVRRVPLLRGAAGTAAQAAALGRARIGPRNAIKRTFGIALRHAPLCIRTFGIALRHAPLCIRTFGIALRRSGAAGARRKRQDDDRDQLLARRGRRRRGERSRMRRDANAQRSLYRFAPGVVCHVAWLYAVVCRVPCVLPHGITLIPCLYGHRKSRYGH